MPKNLKLKAARAEKDLTQSALAEAASICKILGKTLDELFWEE